MIPEEEHQRVLDMGVDVPREKPSFRLPLTEVGIAAKTVWVNLPQGRLPFQAAIFVRLDGDVRGIHMSRIEDLISSLSNLKFQGLDDYAREVLRQTVARQGAASGRIILTGQLPVVRKTPVSRLDSLDSIDVSAEVRLKATDGGASETVFISAGVNHITACPCTQAYYHTLYQVEGQNPPMPTHSQRSFTRLTVEVSDSSLRYDDLCSCLESALHVTHDLLKRPDEAELVLKAHTFPQFAEDAVREVARAAGQDFGSSLPPSAQIIIQSTSLESIHIHNVDCRLETTLGEVVTLL